MLKLADPSQQSQVDSFGSLKACAAKVLNGESQPKILSEAGDGIKRCLQDMAMRFPLRFGTKRAADVSLVDGTQAYALASDFMAMAEVQLIDADGNVSGRLQYIPWDTLNKVVEEQTDTGVPTCWTTRNAFDDSEFLVYPTPNATAATYDLRVTYYQVVDTLVDDSDILDAPKRMGEVLCSYGEWHLLKNRRSNDKGAIDRAWGRYRDILNAFIRSLNREPDEELQWRIDYVDTGTRGYDPLS